MNYKDFLEKVRSLRITRGNFGWWILAGLLFVWGMGFVYAFVGKLLKIDISLFPDGNYYYFDLFLFLINAALELIGFIVNPVFDILSIEFRIEPIFLIGDRNIVIMRVLADAAIVTLRISIISIIAGFIIALILAVILVRPGPQFGLKWFAQAYVDFFRSTPLLVQLFLIYFGVPSLVQNLNIGLGRFVLTEFQAATIGLALNTAAYQAEIIRGGILAIPSGQTEAARALGMTSTQTMRYVILPQALRIIIPPFTNEGINVILNSSLASAVSAFELTRKARNLSSIYFIPFEVYFLAALFYFVMCFSLAKLTKKLEKKFRIPGLGVHHD